MGLLGPEVADAKALAIPLDQAEILVTEKSVEGKEFKEFRQEDLPASYKCSAWSAAACLSLWGRKPNSSGLT